MSSLITRISSNLQLKDDYISSIIRRSNYYYKDYYIPKRNGGRRKISQASPELKTLQYWVKTNILSLLPISKAAFAYNRGNSIKKHATFHKESYFIFMTTTLIVSKKPGNTGKSRNKDTEFTTHLLHSEGALTRCPFP